MKDQKREYFFRCQYQAGDLCISDVINKSEYISIADMMGGLCKLALKVKDEVDVRTGGRVALKVLQIIKEIISNSTQDTHGHGESRKHKLDPKSKHKVNRSERVDVEFYGIGGRDDKKLKEVTRFLSYWKRAKFKK